MTNRFKGLDLVDRAPEELRMEVHNCARVGDQTLPKKKKCKRAKWMPEEALQITEKRRDMKSKGERQRHTQPNAEFERT